jgi:DNA-binding HxlR family transcriptional regulator
MSHGSPEAGAAVPVNESAPVNEHCPIAWAMNLVGSRSAMLLMREAFYGTTRFDDFVRRVEVAPATASAHLRALTDGGLLRRQPYREPGGRSRDEYALTPAGADLMPVIFGLFEWGRRHTGARPMIEFAHAGCGQPIEVSVRCTAGHEVGLDEIERRPAAATVESGAAGA